MNGTFLKRIVALRATPTPVSLLRFSVFARNSHMWLPTSQVEYEAMVKRPCCGSITFACAATPLPRDCSSW
jgi:hypothetical protein